MQNTFPVNNPCSICGKQRIIVSTMEEMVGNSKVVTVEMTCPDADCQKKLDHQLEGERLKRESSKNNFNHNSFGRNNKEVVTQKKQLT